MSQPNELNSIQPSLGSRVGKRGDGYVQQNAGSTPLGGDVHDSLNVDECGGIHNAHTTVQVPGNKKIRMSWDPE